MKEATITDRSSVIAQPTETKEALELVDPNMIIYGSDGNLSDDGNKRKSFVQSLNSTSSSKKAHLSPFYDDLVLFIKDILNHYFYLALQSFNSDGKNNKTLQNRFKLFILPLYSILVAKSLELVADLMIIMGKATSQVHFPKVNSSLLIVFILCSSFFHDIDHLFVVGMLCGG
jgi:hypothetical protein